MIRILLCVCTITTCVSSVNAQTRGKELKEKAQVLKQEVECLIARWEWRVAVGTETARRIVKQQWYVDIYRALPDARDGVPFAHRWLVMNLRDGDMWEGVKHFPDEASRTAINRFHRTVEIEMEAARQGKP